MKETKDTGIFSISMLQEVIDYIEDNLLEEMTPATIASHFYTGVTTISALFKIVCQMTMMEYIRNRRLTLATEELSASDISIIQLAYKYGYETPEAFTKAFTRFHGFPPSFVRRGFPVTECFQPIRLQLHVEGGFGTADLTKASRMGQDGQLLTGYNKAVGRTKENLTKQKWQIHTESMQYQQEWKVLCSLVQELQEQQIPFKVDGKTLIFAHGLEIPVDKICLTFKWMDEELVKSFFKTESPAVQGDKGFKYLDTRYRGMKIRCMFYGDCIGDDRDEFLYRNTDMVQIDSLLVPVQSLVFYYENAMKDSTYYQIVEEWIKKNEGVQCTE